MSDYLQVKNRLIAYIDSLGISNRAFEISIGASNGYINSIKKGIGGLYLERIRAKYPELSIEWLLLNKGEMLIRVQNDSNSFLLSDQGSDAKEPILEEPPSTYQNAELEYLRSMLIDRDRQIKVLQKDKEQLINDKEDLRSDKQRLLGELYDLKALLGRTGSQVENVG